MKRKKSKKQAVVLNFKFSDLFSSDYQIITALLVILPLLIYAQVYDFGFLWDDVAGMGHLDNPFVEHPSWASFTQLFTQPYFGMYIPVSYSLLGIFKAFAELLSLPINSVLHLGNVMVHIVNGLLVFTILKQFIVNKWAVLIGVLFFLLHPIQVEAVAWVSEFRSLLAALFALLSWYYYLKNQTKLSYLALIFFVLAALSKPSAVVLVPFVFLFNYFHYGFKLRKNIEKTLPFALIAISIVIIANLIQITYDAAFLDLLIVYWHALFGWLDSIVFYLYKIIYPYHLSASYTLPIQFILQQWWFYPLAFVPAALGYLLWRYRKTQPLLVFAVALFVAGFFTTSGFVSFAFQQVSLVADRYIYFSMIGIALLIGTIFSKVDKKIWQGLIISVLIVFTALSAFRQIPIWQNPLKLWSHSVRYEITPKYAHYNLAVALDTKGIISMKNTEKYQQAQEYFDEALKYYPKTSKHNILKVFYNKGSILFRQKKYQQAIAYFDKAINITSPNNKKYLAILFSDKGLAFTNMNKYQQAADSFGQAIKSYPQDNISGRSTAFYNKGLALFQLKKYQQALDDFNQAVKIKPNYADANNGKIHLLASLKQCKKAKQAFAFARQHKVKLRELTTKDLHKVCQ